ncbi:MAG TPA: beta-ketoacyl-[acyl-carrier-protein] synthase II [candidate division WOR-3 bacterium]|uniref:3-oxoacyl-[acyl-carrier-protein] synthase 2 n=1 Tax=candidate division WOR-3 bacterium TaxID=2052148 RepID=A0A7V0XFS9_UNCW3|nr:beta-ketoacyl-[acyl-carrier-protein] synthase II [candidate division WOR-3 bacterium]
MKRRAVVTGLGLVTAVGNDVATTWQSLLAGKTGVARIAGFDLTDMAVTIAAEVKEFDISLRLDPKLARRADRFTQFALYAAAEAVADSGLDLAKEDRSRVGAIVGSGMGGVRTWEAQFGQFIEKGPKRVSPLLIPIMIPDMAAGQISITFGLRGVNFCTTSACASGAHAVGEAFRHIVHGDADIIIAGGSEAAVTRFTVSAFANMGALSKRNDEPERASRPFDRERDGFVIAEGCGICVIEELEHARARGARVYGEIAGYGATGDGHHITAPDPEGLGAIDVMNRALAEAGLRPEEVQYINAHGTSTPLNDATEVKAIKSVFGAHATRLAVNSSKSMLGHGLGSAGAMELMVTLKSLTEGEVHATVNFEQPDEGVDLDFVKDGPRELDIRAALSNSFGFGGHNSCIAVRRAD